MRDACCNATSSFAVPDVGRPSGTQATSESVYLRRCPQRSGNLGEAGSVWLGTVERGVLCSEMLVSGFRRVCFLYFGQTRDHDEIGSFLRGNLYGRNGKKRQMLGKKGKEVSWRLEDLYRHFCSTLSIAAATKLAEPNTSDNRFSGVLLRHLRQNNPPFRVIVQE